MNIVEKAFDKVQHNFMLNTLSNIGIEGTFHNIIKLNFEKPNATIILKGERWEAFSLGSGPKQDVHYNQCYLI